MSKAPKRKRVAKTPKKRENSSHLLLKLTHPEAEFLYQLLGHHVAYEPLNCNAYEKLLDLLGENYALSLGPLNVKASRFEGEPKGKHNVCLRLEG